MKTLIITEKPKIACKIAAVGQKHLGQFILPTSKKVLTDDYLKHNEKKVVGEVCHQGYIENDEYVIMYAAGHLVQLFQAEDYNAEYKNWSKIPFPFVPETFKLKVMKESKALFNALKKKMLSSDISDIIVATDADREGQNIYSLIETLAGCKKPVKRLWADAFTEEQFNKAFLSMKENKEYDNLKNAGYCRMISDWLMGGLLTGKATVALGGFKNVINVGRVQTAVLAEIVRVELLNRNHKTRKYYVLKGKFKTPSGEIYEGICDAEEYDTKNDADNVLSKIIKEKTGIVDLFKRNMVKRYSPPLHSQTSLQITMSRNHNISPDDTLSASQVLYENGYTTYPRTGSKCIASGEADDFGQMLKNIVKINPLASKCSFSKNNKRIVNDAEVESHSAITPTVQIPNLTTLSDKEKAVYEELVRSVIAINYPPAVDQEDNALTNVKDFVFKSSGKKEIERGWREVYSIAEKNNPLPDMKSNDKVEVIELGVKEIETKPPKRHTEDSIISFMENCGKKIKDEEKKNILKDIGIGTAATRSEILPKLKRANYITVKGKTLYPTDKGLDVINIFPVDELKNPEYTADLEMMLYKVEKGILSKKEYIDSIINEYKLADSKIKKVSSGTGISSNNSLGTCPMCKGEILKKKGSNGPFYGCGNYKNGCKYTIFSVCGKLPTEAQVKKMLEGKKVIMKGLKKKDGKKLPDAYASLDKDYKIALEFILNNNQNKSKIKK